MVVDLPCGKKSLSRARSKVIKFATDHGFESEAEDVALATQEALKNVIQHACPADNNMHLECIADHDRITVEVSDLGMGFDVVEVEETPVSPMESHGRGIRIIRGLMDEVRITSEQEGTIVHMEKIHRGAS
jgi:serine/threonine-protein kinase RsbW